MNKYIPLAKVITTVVFMVFGMLVAQPSDFQVVHQHPIDPESGLPTGTETEVDTSLILDPETGLSVNKLDTQAKSPPATDELGAKESTKIQQVDEGMYNLLKRFGQRSFPIAFTYGIPKDENMNYGSNLIRTIFRQVIGFGSMSHIAITYGFSKGKGISGYRNLYKSFNLYPELTLGLMRLYWEFPVKNYYYPEVEGFGVEGENIWYGMLEAHKRWEIMNIGAVLILGTGVGHYSTFKEKYNDQGIYLDEIQKDGFGLIVSAGAQLRSRRFMGGLRFYRTPGFGRIVTFVNVGYQPKNYKEASIVGIGYFALFLIIGAIPN